MTHSEFLTYDTVQRVVGMKKGGLLRKSFVFYLVYYESFIIKLKMN